MDSVRRQCSEARSGLTANSPCEDSLEANYVALRFLDEGNFGQVILARHILTGTRVAVKVMSRAKSDQFLAEEIAVMKTVEHPNLVQLFEVIETAEHIYLVMEYVGGGQLLHRIRESVGMEEEEAQRVFRQVVSGVHYCHENGIVHRDLKPDNILLDAQGTVKIIDFGLACRFTPGQKLTLFWGTLRYCAPEILQGQAYGPEVDIWSLGVVLYCMLTGFFPFPGDTLEKLRKQVLRQDFLVPPHISTPARGLICRCLTLDPTQRPTAAQILECRWMKQGKKDAPPARLIPRRPNPALLCVMQHLGYDRQRTRQALVNRTFDRAMATYLMLQRKVSSEAGPELRGAVPPPSPADPSAFPLPPRRRASQPDLRRRRHRLVPSEDPPATEDTQCRQDGGRGASLPAVPLSCPAKRTPPPSAAPQPGPEAPQTSPSRSSAPPPEAPQTSPCRSSAPPPASSAREGRKSWRQVARRTFTRILRACCMPGLGANRVAPKGEGPRRLIFNSKVAPQEAR